MQVIKCYEVIGNTDTTEGRGPMIVAARFSSREAAEKFVRSKAYAKWCVMGIQNAAYDLNNIRESTIIIMDSVDEITLQTAEALKANALAKLTKEERAALGL